MENKEVCTSCGGSLTLDPMLKRLKCEYCGTVIETKEDKKQVKIQNNLVVECRGCGGTEEIKNNVIPGKCHFCGSTEVQVIEEINYYKASGMIELNVGEQEADDIYSQWVKNIGFAPNDLKKLAVKISKEITYVPYYIFNADTVSKYTASGGTYYNETYKKEDGTTGTRRKTRWTNVSGTVNDKLINSFANASRYYPPNVIRSIDSFTVQGLKNFEEEKMIGASKERCVQTGDNVFHLAKDANRGSIERKVKGEVTRTYDTCGSISLDTKFNNKKEKLIMAPVWRIIYEYKGQRYQCFINGQNKKTSGTSPTSSAKVTGCILFIIIIIAIIVWVAYKYFS